MVYFLQEHGDIIGKRSLRSTPDHANVIIKKHAF